MLTCCMLALPSPLPEWAYPCPFADVASARLLTRVPRSRQTHTTREHEPCKLPAGAAPHANCPCTSRKLTAGPKLPRATGLVQTPT